MRRLPAAAPQLAALALLLLLDWAIFPGFFHLSLSGGRLTGSLVDVLDRAAPVALLALGMTPVIAARGIDLSVGAVMAIAGAAAASASVAGASWPVAAACALAAGLAAGLWNGMLVAMLGLQPIVATLVLMVAGRGIAQLITGGRIVTFTDPGLAAIGGGAILGIPVPVVIVLAVAALLALLARRTALGLFVEAIGINPRASHYAGIRTTGILLAVYACSGLAASLAGLIAAADIQGADANNAGLWLELNAILAVVVGGGSLLGGRFSLVRSVLGALVIQGMGTGILLSGFQPEFNLIVEAVVVMAVLLAQSPPAARLMAYLRPRRSA